MKNLDLSIIIVNYNTKQLTIDCIQSVLDTTMDIQYEIILIDNSSDPQEVLAFEHPFVHCYVIPNKGYANANNAGYSHASGMNILLLNPDTIVHTGTINACLEELSHSPRVGAIGCKVLRPDGSLDHACRRGFPTPFNSFCYFTKLYKLFKHPKYEGKYSQYTMSHLPDSISCEVDSLTGAFMMMPRYLVQEIGLFDETFFMYGEDLDLCFRIKEAGYRVCYKADVSILHKKYQSGFAKRSPLVIKHFYHSMILFYDKHYRKKYNKAITFLVRLGVYSIMYLKLLINKIHP